MTAFTKTHIVNFALAHLGEFRIDDISDAGSIEVLANDYWDISRLEALGSYEWSFASSIVQLSRNATAPIAGFSYKYDPPADFVRLNSVYDSSTLNRTTSNWEMRDGFIESSAEDIFIAYVRDHTTIGTWPPWFVMYMSYVLAEYMAPGIVTTAAAVEKVMEGRKASLATARARDSQVRPNNRRPPTGRWYAALRGAKIWDSGVIN